MKLTHLKRGCYTIAILGNKNQGKTMLCSFFAYVEKLNGKKIYSNYPLNFEHTYISGIDQLELLKYEDVNTEKLFIGDDFERWFNSRAAFTNLNKNINDILLDWGKINCSLLYSAKSDKRIDLSLFETTDYFDFVKLDVYRYPTKPVSFDISKYLEFLCIKVERFDNSGEPIKKYLLTNLTEIKKLFDTQYIILKPKFQKKE